MNVPEITVQELAAMKKAKVKFFLLDVRDQWEYEQANLQGHLIPLKDLPAKVAELNPQEKIIVHCQSGGRSSHATQYLLSHGFQDVKNLKGGIIAWTNEIGPWSD